MNFRDLIESKIDNIPAKGGKFWINSLTGDVIPVSGTHINALPILNLRYKVKYYTLGTAIANGWIRFWASKGYKTGSLMFEYQDKYSHDCLTAILEICANFADNSKDVEWEVDIEVYSENDVLVKTSRFDLSNFEEFFA